MKIFTYLILFLMAIPLLSQNETSLITYKKGACFGKCPIYNITVSAEGKLTYIGKRFVDKEGTYERMLSKKEFRKLKCKFRKAKIGKVEMEKDKIMDAATTTYAYKNDEIKLVLGAPKKLQKAADYLVSLSPMSAESEYEWQVTEKPVKEVKKEISSEKQGRIESTQQEIIVQLKDGVEFQIWLKKYHQYGVRMKKKIVPNRELYLLRFEPRSIEFDSLLEKMNADAEVYVAEENKKVEMRGRGRGF